jgi:hypothetical protein
MRGHEITKGEEVYWCECGVGVLPDIKAVDRHLANASQEPTREEVERLVKRYTQSRWPPAKFFRRILKSWLAKDAELSELKGRFQQSERWIRVETGGEDVEPR